MREQIPQATSPAIGHNHPPLDALDRAWCRNIRCILPPHQARMLAGILDQVDAAKAALVKRYDC